MFNKIYEKIKEYDNIVIARHIGVDPDAMCSEIALREAIKLTFPKKHVIAVGSGSSKFNNIGKLDKYEELEDALLIVTDTPDKKRVDGVNVDNYKYSIKIDHHPFIEKFCNLEYIEDNSSSVCEIIMKLLKEVPLKCNSEIAGLLFLGLASDSNRFLFNSSTDKTFLLVSEYIKKYKLNLEELYPRIYMRDISEVRLKGYIGQNLIITDNGVGYVVITDNILKEYKVDSASAGNMINDFNYIDGVPIWVTITEDVKQKIFRVSCRSRGYVINDICERHGGGGHIHACGARVKSIDEAMKIVNDLDELLRGE